MKDKIEKAIEEAQKFPEGEKPILFGPTSAGKSSKFVSDMKRNTTDNDTK